MREKRCLRLKKLRCISISHPRVSAACVLCTDCRGPPGSPAYLPELSSPCLVIYVCVLIFSTSLRTGWDLHISALLILQREEGLGKQVFQCRESGRRLLLLAMDKLRSPMLCSEVWNCRQLGGLWTFAFSHPFPVQVEWSWVGHSFIVSVLSTETLIWDPFSWVLAGCG